VIVFLPLSWVFFADASLATVVSASVSWLVLSIGLDTLCWVIIPHPWQMSVRELFGEHQPWVSLCYAATALCPFVVLLG
ncbi:MAG: hypothetical protein ACRC2T_16780, partial [Thermoguttaceae bacterium]